VLYDIHHKTTFNYEEIVSVSHHVLHLTPRRHPQQTCLESETIVEPKPAVDSSGQDYFGNPIRHLTVQKPHKQLVVDAHARVEVRAAAQKTVQDFSLQAGMKAAWDALHGDAVAAGLAGPYLGQGWLDLGQSAAGDIAAVPLGFASAYGANDASDDQAEYVLMSSYPNMARERSVIG